jgi:hypothetical protein
LTEWGLKFSEQKREAHKNGTKLKRLPEVDVSGSFDANAEKM